MEDVTEECPMEEVALRALPTPRLSPLPISLPISCVAGGEHRLEPPGEVAGSILGSVVGSVVGAVVGSVVGSAGVVLLVPSPRLLPISASELFISSIRVVAVPLQRMVGTSGRRCVAARA